MPKTCAAEADEGIKPAPPAVGNAETLLALTPGSPPGASEVLRNDPLRGLFFGLARAIAELDGISGPTVVRGRFEGATLMLSRFNECRRLVLTVRIGPMDEVRLAARFGAAVIGLDTVSELFSVEDEQEAVEATEVLPMSPRAGRV